MLIVLSRYSTTITISFVSQTVATTLVGRTPNLSLVITHLFLKRCTVCDVCRALINLPVLTHSLIHSLTHSVTTTKTLSPCSCHVSLHVGDCVSSLTEWSLPRKELHTEEEMAQNGPGEVDGQWLISFRTLPCVSRLRQSPQPVTQVAGLRLLSGSGQLERRDAKRLDWSLLLDDVTTRGLACTVGRGRKQLVLVW